MLCFEAAAQSGEKIRITGQKPLSTNEGQPITLKLTDFTVQGSGGGQYPNGFTLEVFPGNNYTHSGPTVTPAAGFTGTLRVPIKIYRMKDGEVKAESERTEIIVEVKPASTPPPPVVQKLTITGQKNLSTKAGEPITLALNDFTVDGPGVNEYPNGFRLEVVSGSNYSFNGTTVTPAAGFTGNLNVNIRILRVQNGSVTAQSDRTPVKVEVRPANTTPARLVITGQKTLSTTQPSPITLALGDFTIDGPGKSEYPKDFRLEVFSGENYTVSGTTVTPDANFTGALNVTVKISRTSAGQVTAESERTPIKVSVKAAENNNPPAQPERLVITGQRTIKTTGTNPVTLELTDFTIDGPGKNEYPKDFKLEVFPGQNYSVNGTTITPAQNFKGTLTVEIRISRIKQGRTVAESDRKGILIQVEQVASTPPPAENTPPQVIGQKQIRTPMNQSVQIGFGQLTVVDPDNNYPNGFKLTLSAGPNYSITSGTTVVPAQNFIGTLSVPVVVNDGKANSEPFDLKVTVFPPQEPELPPDSSIPVFTTFDQSPIPYSIENPVIYISREVTIDDPDSEELFYAEVFFDAATFSAGKDRLSAMSMGNLRSIYDPGTGTLVIFGRESLEVYQQVLQSVQYSFPADSIPVIPQKTIHYRLNDGVNFSEVLDKTIILSEEVVLDIPDIFTPNDDGANDYWVIGIQDGTEHFSFSVRVFDKRGGVVFETNDPDNFWDGRFAGKPVPADAYYYFINISSGFNKVQRKGVVTVKR